MSGLSSQVLWRQEWGPAAESTLSRALASIGCKVVELPDQEWDPNTSTIGGIRDCDATYLAAASTQWTSALLRLNSLIGKPLTAGISELTGGPAIEVLEYGQATWGYSLYEGGSKLDQFWSFPEVVELPHEEFEGSPGVLSRVFGVSLDTLSPYLRNSDDPDAKAFDDDEFPLGDHWVRVDFMRRLGISYPEPGETPGGRYVQIKEPRQRRGA